MTRIKSGLRNAVLAALFAAASAFSATPSNASDWNGAYVGLAIGARAMDADWTTTQTFFPAGAPIPFFSSNPSASLDSTDFWGAGYIGYNWRSSSSMIIGLEGDFGYAKNEDRVADRIPGLGVPNPVATSFADVEATWDASIRARAGFLINPTLMLYGTAGIAFQRIKATATCPADTTVCNPALGTQTFSTTETRTGFTVGGGLEALWSQNWLVRAEYRYNDYGSFNFTAIPPLAGSRFGADADLETQTHTFSVGIAYKFGRRHAIPPLK